MCYNYREYVERVLECCGRRILTMEEMSDYSNWTPY